MIHAEYHAYSFLTNLSSLSSVKWVSGIGSGWIIPDHPRLFGTRHHRCPQGPVSAALLAKRTSLRPPVPGRSRRAGALMTAHASVPPSAWNPDLLLMVGDQTVVINTHNKLFLHMNVPGCPPSALVQWRGSARKVWKTNHILMSLWRR